MTQILIGQKAKNNFWKATSRTSWLVSTLAGFQRKIGLMCVKSGFLKNSKGEFKNTHVECKNFTGLASHVSTKDHSTIPLLDKANPVRRSL